MSTFLTCQDCRSRVTQQEGKDAWVTVGDGARVCPATEKEHRPGTVTKWLTEQALLGRLDPDYPNILEAAQVAVQAAEGYSNDEEIEALRDALECALDGLGMKMPSSYPDDQLYEVEDGD